MSNEMIVVRDLSVISAEINEIKANASGVLRACEAFTKQSVFEIGKRLVEAKEAVGHGNFGAFLETVEYSQSTANNLMRIYTEMGSDEAFASLSYSQLVALFALSVEERKTLLPEVEDKSAREIKRLTDELKKAKEKEAEARDAEASAEADKLVLENTVKELEADKTSVQDRLLTFESLKDKAEREMKRAVKRADDLQKELDELKARPAERRELTEAELSEIRTKAIVEAKISLEKDIAKEALKNDPIAIEVQLLLKSALVDLDKAINLVLHWDNVEMSAKTKILIMKKFDLLLERIRGSRESGNGENKKENNSEMG